MSAPDARARANKRLAGKLFLVESDLPEDVKTLTLSYAFYDVDWSQTRRVGSNARLATHGREPSQHRASSGG